MGMLREYANGEVYEELKQGNIIHYTDSTGLRAEKSIDEYGNTINYSFRTFEINR